jgi:peptide/nickel transport system permease protein
MATITNVNQGAVPAAAPQALTKGVSNTQRAIRRLFKHRMAIFGLLLLVAVTLYVVVGSLMYSEAQANFVNTSNPLKPPTVDHPFGTDALGRDILARTIYGGQISLIVALTSVFISICVGALIGLLSGFIGGTLDAILMRITETLLAIPQLFIALIVVRVISDPERLKTLGISSAFSFAGRTFSISFLLVIFVIGFTSWMRIARIVRAQTLSIKEQEFITAAKSIGVSTPRIVFQHILPNCMGPIIVSATLGVGSAILLEAYLSFLGLGVRPPTASWGNIMQEAGEFVREWHYWFFPAVFITLTVLGINFFGDGLRDALDPKSKG